MITPDRELDPPDEEEENEPLKCDECGDEITGLPYFNHGFPVCNYCKVHVLKIK